MPCNVCVVDHTDELHEAVVSIHSWLRGQVTRPVSPAVPVKVNRQPAIDAAAGIAYRPTTPTEAHVLRLFAGKTPVPEIAIKVDRSKKRVYQIIAKAGLAPRRSRDPLKGVTRAQA